MCRRLAALLVACVAATGAHNHHEHHSQYDYNQNQEPAETDALADFGGKISKRWVPFGEPYQERMVSLLPSSPASNTYPLSFDYPAQPPPPLPYFPPAAPYYQPPPPPQPAAPVILPIVTNQEKQEQNSKDLDVGIYTGMDIPWTHVPPFSTTYKAGLGAQTPPPLMPPAAPPAPSYPAYPYPPAGYLPSYPVAPPVIPVPRPYPVFMQQPLFAPGEREVIYPFAPRSFPYPYHQMLRQQGGFGVKRDEEDVKLTMHVPREGPPGGVLVMEMKANVYRPVY